MEHVPDVRLHRLGTQVQLRGNLRTAASRTAPVCLPMRRGVDSLKVAAAAAVAFWELGRDDDSGSSGAR